MSPEQMKLVRSVTGLGTKDAEISKNIILAYLSEKGYMDKKE